MKRETIPLILQPSSAHSYWADRIYQGIQSAARDFQDSLLTPDPFSSLSLPEGAQVLVAGNRIDWLESTVADLLDKKASPIIVNACMLPLSGLRCSGVVFELEESLALCLEDLKTQGKRCALLGTSLRSAADRVKESAFLRYGAPEDIFRAEGRLEDCVKDFVKDLEKRPYHAVLCANDTVAIRLLHHRKERVSGNEIDVIGMGNSFVGQGVGLTSIEFDYFEMGRAAVRLFHTLQKNPSDCHLLLSLPCHPVVRESARLKPRCKVAPASPLSHMGAYFDGEDVQNVIRIEDMLQNGDGADREILFGLARGETCEEIAQRLFLTDRAVRYRLKNLLCRYNFENRAQLEQALRAAMFPEQNHPS